MKTKIYLIDLIANNKFNTITNDYDYSLGEVVKHYETKHPYLKLKQIIKQNKTNDLIHSIVITQKNSIHSITLLHTNNSFTNNELTLKQNIKLLKSYN